MASPERIDLHDENDIPVLASLLFDRYNHDSLPFLVENFFTAIEFLPQLYSSMSTDERDKARQVIILEILVKFCQLAENFAAFAIAFKKRYSNEKEEILGIYDAIASYEVGHVMDFYKHIKNRNLEYIAQFMGYPPLPIQQSNTREFVEMYCRNVQTDATEIAELYDNLRLLYDAYKHGYRVAFAKNENYVDSFTFFDRDMTQQYVQVSKDNLDKIRRRAKSCQELFKIIFASHKERIAYEKGGNVHNAPVTVYAYTKATDPKPAGVLKFTYPPRGIIDEEYRKEGESVFDSLKEELEKKHKGKIVAIDIDGKSIVASDYEHDKVIRTMHKSNSSGRIMIKRIAKDEKIGITIY